MFVILGVSTGAAEKGITAGIAVGAVIGLEAMFAGPICGASMNPARSLAPAVVSQHFSSLWVYMFAPTAGALFSVVVVDASAKKVVAPVALPQQDLINEKESSFYLRPQQRPQPDGGSMAQRYVR